MKLFIAILCALISHSLAASLTSRNWHKPPMDYCISDDDAQLIATQFGFSVSAPTVALATQLFATNFTDQSDSIIQVANAKPGVHIPLGTVIFPSKAAFIAGQATQGAIPFQQLNMWHTCDTIIVRWVSAQKPNQVQGISVLTVDHAVPGQGGGFGTGKEKYQIDRVFAEFNSGAFLANIAAKAAAS